MRDRRVTLGWALLAGAMLALGYWAGSVIADPGPVVGPPSSRELTFTVRSGTVSQSINYPATASWPMSTIGVNGSQGTVTSVDVQSGGTVKAGQRLYGVDLRPVVALSGQVPAFREMAPGTKGPDVKQLEQYLQSVGLLSQAPDERYTASTAAAVRQWQESLGMPKDGVIRRGDLVFLPSLPTPVALSDEVAVGRSIEPGTEVLRVVTGEPVFEIVVQPEQADLLPLAAEVQVQNGDAVWKGRIASTRTTADNEVAFALTDKSGGAICGRECARAVPVDGESRFLAGIVVVPETSGPMVPTAALKTDGGGATFVRSKDGGDLAVDVLASANGQSILSGLTLGETILLNPER